MTAAATIVAHEVTNNRTGKVTRYKSRTVAQKAMDKADRDYGAVICTRRAIWSDQV